MAAALALTDADRARLLRAVDAFRAGYTIEEIEKDSGWGRGELRKLVDSKEWLKAIAERTESNRLLLVNQVQETAGTVTGLAQKVLRGVDGHLDIMTGLKELGQAAEIIKDLSIATKNMADAVGGAAPAQTQQQKPFLQMGVQIITGTPQQEASAQVVELEP